MAFSLDEPHELERLLSAVDPQVAAILDRARAGQDISADEATLLFRTRGLDFSAVVLVADALRRGTVGDVVTYVVNRNINFTNVCIKHCGFCAFSRDFRTEEGYFLPMEEVVRRAIEAWEYGATEVCIQAGLPPHMEGDLYLRLCRTIKTTLPDMHIHGFSPEEVLYGAIRSRWTIADYLKALQEAGVGSLPGTSAEILDDGLRQLIAPGRISTAQWIDVITTAHRLGLPTTATMMYGHIETDEHKARHLSLLRELQKQTGGFTEFVPLSFVPAEAPMYRKSLVNGLRPGPSGMEIMKVHAVSRIMLNNHIPNLQVSWVKDGLPMSQLCLTAGVNDLGGTLINESISTAAGAPHGQLMRPRELHALIRDAGRIPAERTTTYKIRRRYDDAEVPASPLDLVPEESEAVFGSYDRLVKQDSFRYHKPQVVSTGRP
ncbi:MAG: 5-amino-6-(D-ribitylamino)uracil--L-tyrosine 4-hydroxyphenyl transferase CofH [Acidobacteria bacterium]|nr:5-amino-6-(D-ribitylamino)uracil--L-tyrosine 4-hydroxyphenyl transferase CofH [Acidobacteriota bacterium]MBI3658168.1 5-amino-6-(D-ribitylamino)uracil--L-tyrosine 4-hydroxyphenyl transferase CofH [Acidobacteriota bacterium]